MSIEIVKLDEDTKHFLPHAHQPFDIIGLFIPVFDGENWSYKEKIYIENKRKIYEDEQINPEDYINNDEQTIFLAICDNTCVGTIRISTCWFGYAYIEDISIDQQYRHLGIGKKLMDNTVSWCNERMLSGIALETQDNNVQFADFVRNMAFNYVVSIHKNML